MKRLVVNKKDLEHNIKVIKRFANMEIPKDDGTNYQLIGVVKGNRLWFRPSRIF